MRSSRSVLLLVTSMVLMTACAPESVRDAAPAPLAAPVRAPSAAPANEPVAAADDATPKLTVVGDGSLVESRDSRDPFRAGGDANPPPTDDRPRKSRRYSVDELHLVGLVTSTATPRAMLLDPAGKGWIVTQGELVGKPEEVRAGNEIIVASWRVDRIRAGDVVLVREDPAHREGSLATRVLALPREAPVQAIDD